MSWQATAWAWKQDVRGAQKLLLVAMADMASNDGLCWPAIKYLSSICGSDERYTKRLLKSLQKKGLISCKSRKRTDGGTSSNLYQLMIDPDGALYLDGDDVLYRGGGKGHQGMGGKGHPPLKEQSVEQSVESRITDSPKPEAGEAEKPYPIETPRQRIMCAYKVCLGLEATDRSWDKANWGKWVRAADKLLDAFGGEPNPAIDFMDAFRSEMDRLGRAAGKSWNMATVASRAWDDASTASWRQP